MLRAELYFRLPIFLSLCSLEFRCGNKHVLDPKVSRKEIPPPISQADFLNPVLLAASDGMQNSETQRLEKSNIPWVLSEHIFSGGLQSRLFSTKQMWGALWEPPRFCSERGFLNVTETLWQHLGVVLLKKSLLTQTSFPGLAFPRQQRFSIKAIF